MSKELFKKMPQNKLDKLAEEFMDMQTEIDRLKTKSEELALEIIAEMKLTNRRTINLRGKTLEPTTVSTKIKLKVSKGAKL